MGENSVTTALWMAHAVRVPDAVNGFVPRPALECTWLVDGSREAFDVPGGAERVLRKANGYRAGYDDQPASADCALSETEDGGADSTKIATDVAANTNTVSGTAVDVDLSTTSGPGEASAMVTNHFKEPAVDPDDEADENGEDDDGADGLLPETGAAFSPWVLGLGLLLILGGAGLLLRSRRRA